MPRRNRSGISHSDRSVRSSGGGGTVSVATLAIAAALSLAGCAPTTEEGQTGTTAASPPVTTEALPAPIVLAPNLTGAAPPPAPSPVVNPSEPPGPPAAAAASPSPCPPGSIGMWSPPDAAGVPVFMCRPARARR